MLFAGCWPGVTRGCLKNLSNDVSYLRLFAGQQEGRTRKRLTPELTSVGDGHVNNTATLILQRPDARRAICCEIGRVRTLAQVY
jgi:hypothetical protein